MEGFGVFPQIFFNSFEEQTQLEEETEAMAQCLDAQFLGLKQFQDQNSSIWPYEQAAAYCSNSFEPMNYAVGEEILADSFLQIDSSYQFEGSICMNESNSDEFREGNSAVEHSLQKKRKFQADEHNESSKKKVQKRVKNSRLKNGAGDDEEKNGGLSTSSSGLEDDDSNDSPARSGRGVATESQSLYAKKRREKINERLKILQSLVPNGTKVDISTMLEEAVQYVKFLQLQIKLLSSDEMWMYAPLAYNGINIGLNLIIP